MKCPTCGLEGAVLTCGHGPSAPGRPGKAGIVLPGVTRSNVRYRPLSQGRYPVGWKLTIISILVAAGAGVGIYALASKTTQLRLEARGHIDETVTLEADRSIDYILVELFSGSYDFEVNPIDGAVVMAIGRIDGGTSQEIDPADIRAVLDKGDLVQAGSHHRLTGPLERGRYVWTVINSSKQKPVQVTIHFHAH